MVYHYNDVIIIFVRRISICISDADNTVGNDSVDAVCDIYGVLNTIETRLI